MYLLEGRQPAFTFANNKIDNVSEIEEMRDNHSRLSAQYEEYSS
jgi:hypothetical protein